jgi:hypothetical protein
MLRIVDASNANLPYSPSLLGNFSAAARTGTVNRAELIATESHRVPPRELTVVFYRESEITAGILEGGLELDQPKREVSALPA